MEFEVNHTHRAKEDHSCLHTRNTNTHTRFQDTYNAKSKILWAQTESRSTPCPRPQRISRTRSAGQPRNSPHPSSPGPSNRSQRREGAQTGRGCSRACPGLRDLGARPEGARLRPASTAGPKTWVSLAHTPRLPGRGEGGPGAPGRPGPPAKAPPSQRTGPGGLPAVRAHPRAHPWAPNASLPSPWPAPGAQAPGPRPLPRHP